MRGGGKTEGGQKDGEFVGRRGSKLKENTDKQLSICEGGGEVDFLSFVIENCFRFNTV